MDLAFSNSERKCRDRYYTREFSFGIVAFKSVFMHEGAVRARCDLGSERQARTAFKLINVR